MIQTDSIRKDKMDEFDELMNIVVKERTVEKMRGNKTRKKHKKIMLTSSTVRKSIVGILDPGLEACT